jgi:hypothetical protein
MKRIIRLTESDLHRIIKNSVKRILKEDSTFDNHIAGNIYDDIIQKGIYRRIQPDKLKDFIINSYGLNYGEERIANIVVNKVMKYENEMETQYGLTEAYEWWDDESMWNPQYPGEDEDGWSDNDEVDRLYDETKEERFEDMAKNGEI